MSLDNFGETQDSQAVQRFGKSMIEKYSAKACKAAVKLEDSNINSGSARTYKPQVRQVVSELDDENPDPREVSRVIASSDKQGSTKNVMVTAIKKYYEVIDEYSKRDELDKIAKEEQLAEVDFDRGMEVDQWITKDEVLRIEEHILPPKGERFHQIDGPGKSVAVSLEHKALVMTLFYTGCRVGEVCQVSTGGEALMLSDLHPGSGRMNLYRSKKKGKGYKRDMKVVPSKLWDVLDEYTQEYNIGSIQDDDDTPIFPFVKRTAQNRISDIHSAYEFVFGQFEHIDKLTPHKFRHGRITDIANHSGLEEAGQYVEHSSPEVTNAYRHLAAEQQREMLPESDEHNGDIDVDELVEQVDGVDTKEELIDELS